MPAIDRDKHRGGERRHRAGHADRHQQDRRQHSRPIVRMRPNSEAQQKAAGDHKTAKGEQRPRSDARRKPAQIGRSQGQNRREGQQRRPGLGAGIAGGPL